ncbi:hypothetical protein BDV06DRAFT_184096 [Aspergillus oleicola]
MEPTLLIKSLLSCLEDRDIAACLIGEIALNFYGVPRVVHNIEICVPESSLSEAVSTLCFAAEFEEVEMDDYDLFTEYKRGFPTLKAPGSSLQLVVFPDSHFGLSNLADHILPPEERLSSTRGDQILDLVPREDIQHLPVPRLSPFFTGLCSRYFDLNDCMARIAVEQLVDGMDLDDSWVQTNLIGEMPRVQELASQLVAEKAFRCNEELIVEVPYPGLGDAMMEDLTIVPGSGF